MSMSHAMRQDLAMFITTFIFENNKLCLEKNMSIILPISPKLVKCSSSVPAASLGKTPRIPFMTRKERRHEIGKTNLLAIGFTRLRLNPYLAQYRQC